MAWTVEWCGDPHRELGLACLPHLILLPVNEMRLVRRIVDVGDDIGVAEVREKDHVARSGCAGRTNGLGMSLGR